MMASFPPASVFSASANVWAPRYRQAAFGAFLTQGEDRAKALNLARSDYDLKKSYDFRKINVEIS